MNPTFQLVIQDILKDPQHYVNMVLTVIGALTSIATVWTKLTPSPDDDKKLSDFLLGYHKFLAFLPTFGVNPSVDVVASQATTVEEKK